MNKPLRTVIEREGQAYLDEPVYAVVSRGTPVALAVERTLPFGLLPPVQYVFGKVPDDDVSEGLPEDYAERIAPLLMPRRKVRNKITALTHYNHVPLRWMEPGPDGKLVPRKS